MPHNLIKLCDQLDQQNKYHKVDSITEHLIRLAKSKFPSSDLPTILLNLEKTGVDTSEYYNALLDKNLTKEQIQEIKQKYKTNCLNEKIKPKSTDLNKYISWMTKDKDKKTEEKSNSNQYLSELRDKFIDFITHVVVKDYKKENTEISPQNLIDFYFQNREKYENDLDAYDLMIGQTEGILSDENFVDQLKDENIDKKDMHRVGE
jgi:hypothetical protein